MNNAKWASCSILKEMQLLSVDEGNYQTDLDLVLMRINQNQMYCGFIPFLLQLWTEIGYYTFLVLWSIGRNL